jgi:U3 small nucleolar RNA-associated protein 11
MSSLRNAVQRRNHRERAQPAERAKWGLLEKRKDYKLRAADHKAKTKKINALKSKASERNEDEFYFGMMSSTSKGGIKVAKRGEANSGGGGKVLSQDVVRLMKTQDQGYLQTMLQRTRKELSRLEEDVLLGETGVRTEPDGGARKVVFDDEGLPVLDGDMDLSDLDESLDLEDFNMDSGFLDEEDEEDGSGEEESDDEDLTSEERLAKSRKKHSLSVKRKKLDALKEQEDKLSAALEGLGHQRAQMAGTIGGVNKSGVKFKARQRKR